MKKYHHILATVDLFQNKLLAVDSAVQLAETFGAKLSIVCIVMHSLYNSYGFLGEMDVEEAMSEQAKEKMRIVGARYNIPDENQMIKVGHPRSDIVELAREIEADLIVVGSHHHKILGMLGSTASAIVNNAHCDVLLIKED